MTIPANGNYEGAIYLINDNFYNKMDQIMCVNDTIKIKGIFNRINSAMPEYTKSEKKVALFVLKEKQNITNMTILDIAQGAGVSEASVMRFCNRLGIKKLIDFRIQVAKDSEKEKVISDGSLLSLEDDYINVIKNTSSLVDIDQIRRTIDILEKVKEVHFFGIAASSIAARVANDSFWRMGVRSNVETEGHFQSMRATMMGPDDLLVSISLSGNTQDIYEASLVAKDSGAFVVAITSYAHSKLAKCADIVLLTSAKEDIIDGGKITGCISQMYIIDCLKREYASRHKNNVASIKEQLGKLIIVKKDLSN